MRNIALILMYNGTAYHGWQVQKTERTVAETLEKGLSMVCGEKIKCVGCGRTDAGGTRGILCGQFPYRLPYPRGAHPLRGEYPYPRGHRGAPGL